MTHLYELILEELSTFLEKNGIPSSTITRSLAHWTHSRFLLDIDRNIYFIYDSSICTGLYRALPVKIIYLGDPKHKEKFLKYYKGSDFKRYAPLCQPGDGD